MGYRFTEDGKTFVFLTDNELGFDPLGTFGGRVVVEQLPIGRAEVDEMPVLLENPMAVRPFEVLLRHFRLAEPALRNLAEIVHDIDLKDGKFARPEALGLDRLIAGIAMRHPDDAARLSQGAAAFDSLYEYFRRRR